MQWTTKKHATQTSNLFPRRVVSDNWLHDWQLVTCQPYQKKKKTTNATTYYNHLLENIVPENLLPIKEVCGKRGEDNTLRQHWLHSLTSWVCSDNYYNSFLLFAQFFKATPCTSFNILCSSFFYFHQLGDKRGKSGVGALAIRVNILGIVKWGRDADWSQTPTTLNAALSQSVKRTNWHQRTAPYGILVIPIALCTRSALDDRGGKVISREATNHPSLIERIIVIITAKDMEARGYNISIAYLTRGFHCHQNLCQEILRWQSS